MTTEFQIKYVGQYLAEIFGSEQVKDPLLNKNISQRTKFQLKRLGLMLQKDYKEVLNQTQEIFNKYSEEKEVPQKEGEAPIKRKVIKEEFKETFMKEAGELEEGVVTLTHDKFEERDFIDKSTGDIVAGNTYYNVIDILLWEKQEEAIKETSAVA